MFRKTVLADVVGALLATPRYKHLHDRHVEFEPPSPARKPKSRARRRKQPMRKETYSLPLPNLPATQQQLNDAHAIELFKTLAKPEPLKHKPFHFDVLDVGFGMGETAEAVLAHCRAPFVRVCGLDCDPEVNTPFGEDLKERYGAKNFRFVPGAMSAVGGLFGERSFDGIVVDLGTWGACEAQWRDDRRGFELNDASGGGPCSLKLNVTASPATNQLNSMSYMDLMGWLVDDTGLKYHKANEIANVVLRMRPFESVLDVSNMLESAFGPIQDDVDLWEASPRDIERCVTLRAYRSLIELVNNEREEFRKFLLRMPEVLRGYGRCVFVVQKSWQWKLLRELEKDHPFLYSPTFVGPHWGTEEAGLFILEKTVKPAYDQKVTDQLLKPVRRRPPAHEDVEKLVLDSATTFRYPSNVEWNKRE